MSKKSSRTTTRSPQAITMKPRVREVLEQLAVADQIALALIVMGPFCEDDAAIDYRQALFTFAKALPRYAEIEAVNEKIEAAAKRGDFEAAYNMWGGSQCDFMAFTEDYAFMLGWAFGARLGSHATEVTR
jgi:hypothetical protein